MRIAVIGAGVIGLTAAKALHDAGHNVIVVDQRKEVGTATSFANGAQLSYSYVAPLAGPGVLSKLPGWMLRSDSPVRFRPGLDLDQWRWCLSFAAACNSKTSEISTRRTLALSMLSRALMHKFVEEEPDMAFDYARSGKLVVHRDAKSMRKATAQLIYQKELGCEQIPLTTQQCIALEPALWSMEEKITGGIFTESEDAADCFKFCKGLESLLRNAGVEFSLSTRVDELSVFEAGKVVAMSCGQPIQADAYVMAGGIESRALLRRVDVNVPLYPLKGYSLTYDLGPTADAPRVSVTDFARKVVYARIGDRLRVAGIADLEGPSLEVRPGRIQTLKNAVHDTFPQAIDNTNTPTEWVGLRPATPTGLPIIGPTRYKNLWLNVGHGALGFTLAAGSAALLASLVDGKQDSRLADLFAMPR